MTEDEIAFRTIRSEIPRKVVAYISLTPEASALRGCGTGSWKSPKTDLISATSSMHRGTKIKPKKNPTLKLNEERIDDAVLCLLYCNLYHCGVVWKGFDWDAMNRLHEKGLISDPVRKAKSVRFSEEGEKQARKIFETMFLVDKSESCSGGRVKNA